MATNQPGLARTLQSPRTGSSIRPTAIVGLVIAFGWVLIPLGSGHQITNVHDDVVNICSKWIVVAVLGTIAFGLQHRRPAEFGIVKISWRDTLVAFAGAVTALILAGVVGRLVAIPSSISDLRAIAAIPVWVRIALVLTVAICEEFIYRGFAIEEIALLGGKRWLAGAASLILFTLSHAGLYGLSASLLVPGVVATVLTLIYLWRCNLGSCILMHTIVDGFFLIAIPALTNAH